MTTPTRAEARHHVVLIGLMGVGKSAVARELAARTGRPLLDVDEQVEGAAGCTIPELFAREGEAAFRALEAEVAAEALRSPVPAVVALGGGAVLDEGTRSLARSSGEVVWLRASPAVLARRLGDGAGRPLLADGDVAARLERLAVERGPVYEAAAHRSLDVDDLTPAQAAELILAGGAR